MTKAEIALKIFEKTYDQWMGFLVEPLEREADPAAQGLGPYVRLWADLAGRQVVHFVIMANPVLRVAVPCAMVRKAYKQVMEEARAS